jgi:Helix-turn-helix domain
MRREGILAERSDWDADDDLPLLTTGDAAAVLGVSAEMVRKYVRQRRLACAWTVGRRPQRMFREREVQRLAEERGYLALAPVAPRTRRRGPQGQLRLRLFQTQAAAKGRLRIPK